MQRTGELTRCIRRACEVCVTIAAVLFTANACEADSSQPFMAEAIIKDGPFYVRKNYRQRFPQVCVGEKDFVYDHTVYVSPDHVAPRGITYNHDSEQKYLPTKSHDIRLVFELPDTVEVVGLCGSLALNEASISYPQVVVSSGQGPKLKRYTIAPPVICRAPKKTAVDMVYFRTTLPVGSVTRGCYYLEWKGGKQKPQPIRIESIHIPKVIPPKKMFIGVWGVYASDLKLMCPNFPEDFTSLGLNTISLYYTGHYDEGSDSFKSVYDLGDRYYQAARDRGIFIMYSPFFPWTPSCQYSIGDWVRKDPEARALDIEGSTVPNWTGYLPCPSYRGKYYVAALDRIKTCSQLKRWPASFFNMDLEVYGGRATKICFCPRCVGLFEKWFSERHPELKYIDPVTLNREVKRVPAGPGNITVTTKYPEHYRAWVDFKTEQYADMWKGMREALSQAVGDVRTAPFEEVILADWAGAYEEPSIRDGTPYGLYTMKNAFTLYAVGSYGPAGLAVLDNTERLVDLYYNKFKMRRSMYDTPPTSGYGWYGSGFATKPERTKYYLLESAMNGVQGMLLYNLGGFEAKQMAINATIFDSFRLVDDLITEGARTYDLRIEGRDMHVRGFEMGNERLILVGDHYVATDRRKGILTCPVTKELDVYDILERRKLGTLAPGREALELTISGLEDRARFLYVGDNWASRLKRGQD